MEDIGGVRAEYDGIEISPRFRRSLEERIARLELDAVEDESQIALLRDDDHIRRQMRLVAVQRTEALRMRLFLDQAGTRQACVSNGDRGNRARGSGVGAPGGN